ncbi:MAG: hypothetical protein WB615_11240 [Candidatus Tumulicola sp.]
MDDTDRDVLRWFRANGPDGAQTESNSSTLDTPARLAGESLGIHVSDLLPRLQKLKEGGLIHVTRRPGYFGIFRTTISDAGLKRLEALESKPARGKPLVFVSCGQTDEEYDLGESIAAIITKETPAEGYFAKDQTSFKGVTDHILGALSRCSGFVGILHKRGQVAVPNWPPFDRASVWVEQEIAIATYISEIVGKQLQVQLYIQDGVRLEGLRDKVMLNAVPFDSNDEVLEHFSINVKRLFSEVTASRPNITVSPLGAERERKVTLVRRVINPDFVLGCSVVPTAYGARRTFDSSDEREIQVIEIASRGKQSTCPLHSSLKADTLMDGVWLTSGQRERQRGDGSPLEPEQQIECDSDGEVVIRFEQNDESPFWQYLCLIGTVFVVVGKLYAHLTLEKTVRMAFRLNLHAGRQNSKPVLPGGFDLDGYDADFAKSFAECFADVTLRLLRKGGETVSRESVVQDLSDFADKHLPL